MAFEDFLNHSCDIYHIVSEGTSPGYNLTESPAHSYPDNPDISNVPCHFAQKMAGGVNTITQFEPNRTYEDRIKLILPIETDIRVNDKVLDHRTGLMYQAEIPRVVRNHHKFVYVKREGNEASL